MLKTPDALEFLEAFHIEPVETETDLDIYYYEFTDPHDISVKFSFSKLLRSFKILLYKGDVLISHFYHENADEISILDYRNNETFDGSEKFDGKKRILISFDSGVSNMDLFLVPYIYIQLVHLP